MEEMIEWLCRVDDVAVGIFDATNTTIKRRERILERGKRSGVKILFIESICSDPGTFRAAAILFCMKFTV